MAERDARALVRGPELRLGCFSTWASIPDGVTRGDHRYPVIPASMIGRISIGALAICVAVAILAYALHPFEESSGRHHESPAAAETAISSLPYPIKLTKSTRDRNVLIGQVIEKSPTGFRFYVVVESSIPSWLQPSVGTTFSASSLTPGYSYLGPLVIESKRRGPQQEQTIISLAIQEALCRQATKKPCPA